MDVAYVRVVIDQALTLSRLRWPHEDSPEMQAGGATSAEVVALDVPAHAHQIWWPVLLLPRVPG